MCLYQTPADSYSPGNLLFTILFLLAQLFPRRFTDLGLPQVSLQPKRAADEMGEVGRVGLRIKTRYDTASFFFIKVLFCYFILLVFFRVVVCVFFLLLYLFPSLFLVSVAFLVVSSLLPRQCLQRLMLL